MARILHLISQLEEGGAQRQLSYVISHAQRQEMEVASLVASPREKLFPFFRNAPVPIHFLSTASDFYSPEIMPALGKLLKEGKFSLIHCWLYQSIVQGVIACRLVGAPVIASPRNMREILRVDKNKSWERFLIEKTLGIADLVLFPSHSAAIDFVDAGWVETSRARVVQNGVDTDYFGPVQGGNLLVAVGRLVSQKSYEDLEEIVSRLRTRLPDLRCVVMGGGNIPSSQNLDFIGFQEDIREVLQEAAVFVATSRTEGMSNALLEAQSMGIPAVARRIGSNSEIIREGVTGFLVGTIDEFVAACLRLLEDTEFRAEMAQKARERIVSEFSIQGQVSKIESIYGEILNR